MMLFIAVYCVSFLRLAALLHLGTFTRWNCCDTSRQWTTLCLPVNSSSFCSFSTTLWKKRWRCTLRLEYFFHLVVSSVQHNFTYFSRLMLMSVTLCMSARRLSICLSVTPAVHDRYYRPTRYMSANENFWCTMKNLADF